MEEYNNSISGLVWLDEDKDGLYLETDELVTNATIELYDCNDLLIQSVINTKGKFIIEDITPGTYYLKYVTDLGYGITVKNETPVTGSVANEETGVSDTFEIEEDTILENMNTGFIYVSCGGPKITMLTKYIKQASSYEPLDLIQVIDCRGIDITSEAEVVMSTVDPMVIGDYRMRYEAIDYAGVSSSLEATYFVEDIQPPIIEAYSSTIKTNDTFDPMNEVTAINGVDEDITSSIIVTKNEVNVDIEGVYQVSYEVTDLYKQTSTKTIEVTVEANISIIDQSINDLITSVALEQTALSTILDAESLKIEAAINIATCSDDVIKVNESVEDMIEAISKLELILQTKLLLFKNN